MSDEKVTAIRPGVEVEDGLAMQLAKEIPEYVADHGEQPNGYLLVLFQDTEADTLAQVITQPPPGLSARACQGIALAKLVKGMG